MGANVDILEWIDEKSIVNATSQGSIITKTYEEAYDLLEKLASNHHQMAYDRTVRKPMARILQIDAFNALSTQIVVLSK